MPYVLPAETPLRADHTFGTVTLTPVVAALALGATLVTGIIVSSENTITRQSTRESTLFFILIFSNLPFGKHFSLRY